MDRPQETIRRNEDLEGRQEPWLRRPANILLAVALIACSGLLAYKVDESLTHPGAQAPARQPAPPRDRYAVTKTRAKCLCAKSFDDVSALTQAYREGDAVPEPLSSGRVVWLAQGTSVQPFDIDKDLTTVLVQSGDNSGERCHLLTKFVQ